MKKLLLSLFVGLFTLIGFGNCGYLGNAYSSQTIRVSGGTDYNGNFELDESWVYCLRLGNYDVNFTGIDNLGNTLDNSNYDCYTNMNFSISVHNGSSATYNIFIYKVNLGTGSNFGNGVNIEFLAGNGNEDFLSADYIGVDSGTFVFYVYGDGNYSTGFSYDSSENSYTYEISFSGNNNTGNCELMSSLDCQLEYNLIPINEVTENYCIINHNLIRPNDCPINSSGDIQRTPIFINNTQYPGTNRLDIFINEDLQRSITYESGAMEINVNGYNIDTNYINDIINKEKLTPTKEEFGNLLTGMKDYLPYIMVALLLGWTIRVLKKVFKF